MSEILNAPFRYDLFPASVVELLTPSPPPPNEDHRSVPGSPVEALTLKKGQERVKIIFFLRNVAVVLYGW